MILLSIFLKTQRAGRRSCAFRVGLCRPSLGIGHNLIGRGGLFFLLVFFHFACVCGLFFFFSFYFCMLNQVDPGRCVNEEGGRGQLWSPMEEDEEDAEERRHGGRDEMHSSSALHGVLLEGRG